MGAYQAPTIYIYIHLSLWAWDLFWRCYLNPCPVIISRNIITITVIHSSVTATHVSQTKVYCIHEMIYFQPFFSLDGLKHSFLLFLPASHVCGTCFVTSVWDDKWRNYRKWRWSIKGNESYEQTWWITWLLIGHSVLRCFILHHLSHITAPFHQPFSCAPNIHLRNSMT